MAAAPTLNMHVNVTATITLKEDPMTDTIATPAADVDSLEVLLEIEKAADELPQIVFTDLPLELRAVLHRDNLVQTAAQSLVLIRSIDAGMNAQLDAFFAGEAVATLDEAEHHDAADLISVDAS